MRRKARIAAYLIAIIALIAVFFAIMPVSDLYETDYTVSDFRLEDYQLYLDEFSTDRNVGPVSGAEDALEKAKEVWLEVYGDSSWVQQCVSIEKWPVKFCFDQQNSCWLVFGKLPDHTLGGTPCIIFDSEGNVLALWHGQ